jgi:predicted metal-binding membrane protein
MMSQAARDRILTGAGLAVVLALAWGYLWSTAETMELMTMPGMSLATAVVLAFVMWAVMMAGMMLPSAAPAIVFYGAIVRKNRERGSVLAPVWTFVAGYLAMWTAFSLVVAVVQALLQREMLLTPMIESASVPLSAAVLFAAGFYQWLPVKNTCLRACRHPMEFFVTRWRGGATGAFRMGLEHGLYCLGCCWVLMLVLFVTGAMDLLWVALLAAFVFVEKLLPGAAYTSRIAGLALIGWGLWLVAA